MERPPIDPNVVTSLRLPLAPVAVAFLVAGHNGGSVWWTVAAAVLALLLELSDLLDGWIARRYKLVTDFGKLYDPFSDAFCRYTIFLGLYAIDVASLWMVLAIFYRDAAISFFRTVAATRDVIIDARPTGKIKAVVQGVGTQLIMGFIVAEALFPALPFEQVPYWLMVVITLVTVASFFDYFRGNLPTLRDAWENRPLRKKRG